MRTATPRRSKPTENEVEHAAIRSHPQPTRSAIDSHVGSVRGPPFASSGSGSGCLASGAEKDRAYSNPYLLAGGLAASPGPGQFPVFT